ncbi:MAG TPA: family 2A encapsulin nanocompartment cargo protein cysteine desulfurase [Kofleriaceae bacterium]|jgi:cysteine desulfurase/selenocysteine lyase
MSTDDPTQYAPPLEMRVPLGSVVDTSDGLSAATPLGSAPAPSAISGASPGAGTGAAQPLASPTLPDFSDPQQISLLVSKLWGEHMTGASIVPAPGPAQSMSGVNAPQPNNMAAGSPGASVPSGLASNAPSPGSDPTSPASGAVPQPDFALFAVSLAPAQIESPTALPQSPSAGGGGPSPTSGGGSYQPPGAIGGLPVGAAPGSDVPASVAPVSTSAPNASSGSTSSGVPAVGAPSTGAHPSTGSSSQASVPRASNGASTGTTDASTLTSQNGDSHGNVPSSIGPEATQSNYRHGGADSGGHDQYGAPPQLDSIMGFAGASFRVPTVDASPSRAPNASPSHAPNTSPSHAPNASPSPAPLATPQPPSGVATPPAPAHDADLPIPSTENPFAAPLQLPFTTPTVANAPSAPMGHPTAPSASHVPSSAPFGSPVDFSGIFANPTHPSMPSVATPPSAPRTEAWPGSGNATPPTSDLEHANLGRIEMLDAKALDSLARGDSDPLFNDTSRVAFDPYRVRQDFPILNERPHGKRLVWLDNGATTHKPRQVIDRISYFYEHENSNVHRAAHTLAARSSDAYERARESVRRFLNAPSVKEVVWVRGTTEGINLIAKSWGKRHIGKGDEIVISHLEHHANIVPWQMLCAETGAKLRVAPVDSRGDVILEEFEKCLGPRTKLVAITHVSNALGTISPVKRMTEIAHRYGAQVMVDGAQGVSHMKIDVQDIGCEWYVFSGHKVYAPTGIGAVWAKADIWDQTPAWQGGGNMIADVTFEKTSYQPSPWKFEAGTGNIADAVGLGAAIEYVERIGMDVIDRYEHDLLVYGTECLLTVPGLTIIGTSRSKAGVMSFVLDGQRTEDVSAILDKDGIAVRSGHHCAQPILRRFGVEATVRASLAVYNIREDVDALVDALHRLQAGRNRP